MQSMSDKTAVNAKALENKLNLPKELSGP